LTIQELAKQRMVAIITAVGGHFINGRRAKGYAYLFAFVALSLLTFATQVVLGLVGVSQVSIATLSALLFGGGLISIWFVSAAQAIKDHRKGSLSGIRTSVLEIAFATLATYGVVLYSLLVLVLAPRMEPGKEYSLFEYSSGLTRNPAFDKKFLPNASGNVVLAGALFEKDRPLGGARLTLLFQNGYRTPMIQTDGSGRFEYRLPPGEWRFIRPLVSGFELRTAYVVFSPTILHPVFNVGTGDPTTRVAIKVVVE
jgi:hypothetical protein